MFIVYIDELLCRLRNSGYGCHVGNNFCGAFGYADDVVLLCPNVTSLNKELDICAEYATEYNVHFNSTKSKVIVNTCRLSHHVRPPDITFMGGIIDVVSWDKHLGNPIGNISHADIVHKCIVDFMTRVNMVKYHFYGLPVATLYSLFKTYCMPLYGSQLWDLSDRSVDKFYVAWRKAIRYLFNLPYKTHCVLLPLVCDDCTVQCQLYKRFVQFYRSLNTSHNSIVGLCAKLVLKGSRSSVSNSLSVVCNYYNHNRYDISHVQILSTNDINDMNDVITASVICELLNVNSKQLYLDDSTFPTQDVLYDLCVN